MLITPEYADLNRQKHAIDNSGFGRSGHFWAEAVYQIAQQIEARTILDYGSGKGTFAESFRERDTEGKYQLFEYDPGVPGKDSKPLRADMVVCTDVLEHVEPECLNAVLDDIKGIARSAVFLVIPMIAAKKTLPDGRNAHLTVASEVWWLPRLMSRWQMRLYRDLGLGQAFMFLGQKR